MPVSETLQHLLLDYRRVLDIQHEKLRLRDQAEREADNACAHTTQIRKRIHEQLKNIVPDRSKRLIHIGGLVFLLEMYPDNARIEQLDILE